MSVTLTNAEKQARYRERHLGVDGEKVRVGLNLNAATRAKMGRLGGPLTPWHTIDGAQLWSAVCGPHFPAPEAAAFAAALYAAESQLWRAAIDSQRSATMAAVFELAGVVASAELIASYLSAWEPHTFTDPDVPELLRHLRGRGIKVGVLSNTMWPREWHEDVFRRDGVLDLIDGAV
jgi:putative hydrolase of the HAD superfamily